MNRLIGTYLLLSGVALVGSHRAPWAPLLLLLHLAAGIGLVFAERPLLRTRGAAVWLAAAWPLLVMPLLYAELPLLNRALYGGDYFDPLVIGWERAVFGDEPARELAGALPYRWLSEALHAAYVSYYLIIYVPPILIGWKHGPEALQDTVFTLMLVFLAHYLFFIYFPVEGPRYRFPAPGAEAANGPLREFARALLESGSSRGAAFPSSHVGVSVAATVACWRWLRPLAPVVGLLTTGLAVGAVYGGFHYAIDAVIGALLGLVLALAAPALRARLGDVRP